MRISSIIGLCAIAWVAWLPASASVVLVEAESFADTGGWALDTQFVDQMGSAYLLAHGKGVPVADALTTVTLPSAGTWRLWVRTRDWTPDYAGEKPGRFQIALNGATLPTVFGIAPATWGWVDGGTTAFESPAVAVRLVDLTGFEGRCDALAFTDDLGAGAPPAGGAALAAWRAQACGEGPAPELSGDYDLVVVGGGLAGTCAAIAAAETNLTVALIQDRPVLGGNGSGEIRVQTQGEKRHRIVTAVANDAVNMSSNSVTYDARRLSEVAKHPNISLFTGWRAYGVVTNGARQIESVDARDMRTGVRRRFRAPLFADCTGDAWLGYWAGASYRVGREAAAEFGESRAPAVADAMTMGSTLMWTTRMAAAPTTFPSVPWALTVAGSRADTHGDWFWEYGMHLNTISDAEAIRDHLFRAIYGNFFNAKKNAANANLEFDWVPYVAGKRESRRLVGDHTLTQGEIVSGVYFEDSVGSATWAIDLHYTTTVSYLSTYTPTVVSKWYYPFRCLYSRDVSNLFMAGRNISVSHVALGSPRVMNTCGQMGVAVGYAAGVCKQYGLLPRDVYRSSDRTGDLQKMISGAFPTRVIVEPEPPEVAVQVDNEDVPSADIHGVWTSSVSAAGQFEGTNYLHDGNTGKGADKWIRYAPDLPETAYYEVRQKWSSGDNRATNVMVEVAHADGTNTVTVNMRQNGGVWNALGVWRFAEGASGSARILTAGTTGSYVIADAFRFVKSGSVTVDNPAAELSGAWVGSVNMTGQFYGTNYLHNNAVASTSLWARFRPNLSEAGVYRLQGMWNGSAGRATAAKIEVVYADGVVTNAVDMNKNSGVWNTLGLYRFAAGTNGYARILTAGAGSATVIADAFRWIRSDDVIVDNADAAGVTVSGRWVGSQSEARRYGTNYLHNNRVSSPTNWVRFTPQIRAAGSYDVRAIWNGSAPDRASNVTVEVVHASGTNTVQVNMQTNSGVWNSLGVWTFGQGSGGSVRILTAGTTAGSYVIADAVCFASYVKQPDLYDWDANGLPDAWERVHFLNEGGADPDADPDRDGLSNFSEYLTGADPLDVASTFVIREVVSGETGGQPQARTLVLRWPSVAGRVYDVLWAEKLGDPFTVIDTGVAAAPPMNSYSVASDRASGFFKVVARFAQ